MLKYKNKPFKPSNRINGYYASFFTKLIILRVNQNQFKYNKYYFYLKIYSNDDSYYTTNFIFENILE